MASNVGNNAPSVLLQVLAVIRCSFLAGRIIQAFYAMDESVLILNLASDESCVTFSVIVDVLNAEHKRNAILRSY